MDSEDTHGGPWARTLNRADGTILPPARWQLLASHLHSVGQRARDFGVKIGVPDWAFLAGVWHDLGKYHPDFQRMLREVSQGREKRRVDHSTAGAIHASKVVATTLRRVLSEARMGELQLLLTATIAGHHGGLPDGTGELEARLDDPEKTHLYETVKALKLPREIWQPVTKMPSLPARLEGTDPGERRLRTEMLVRMVLSAVVDADRLDAERFVDSALPEAARASTLRTSYATIPQLRAALDAHIDAWVATLKPETMAIAERQVFDYRQAVLHACRAAAVLPRSMGMVGRSPRGGAD